MELAPGTEPEPVLEPGLVLVLAPGLEPGPGLGSAQHKRQTNL